MFRRYKVKLHEITASLNIQLRTPLNISTLKGKLFEITTSLNMVAGRLKVSFNQMAVPVPEIMDDSLYCAHNLWCYCHL
jgi:hypothetical protein